MRVTFAAAGVLLMLPHQVSTVVLGLNVAGFVLAIILVGWELKYRRTYVRA